MRKLLIAGCFCGLLLSLAWAVAAAPGELRLDWWTVDGGGGTVVGSGPAEAYTLSGTAGQPDAGVMAGGDYLLAGGFRGGGVVAETAHRLYLPVVVRNR